MAPDAGRQVVARDVRTGFRRSQRLPDWAVRKVLVKATKLSMSLGISPLGQRPSETSQRPFSIGKMNAPRPLPEASQDAPSPSSLAARRTARRWRSRSRRRRRSRLLRLRRADLSRNARVGTPRPEASTTRSAGSSCAAPYRPHSERRDRLAAIGRRDDLRRHARESEFRRSALPEASPADAFDHGRDRQKIASKPRSRRGNGS